MATSTLVAEYYPYCFLVSRFVECVGERGATPMYNCDNILPLIVRFLSGLSSHSHIHNFGTE
jgi:hypothetical protein